MSDSEQVAPSGTTKASTLGHGAAETVPLRSEPDRADDTVKLITRAELEDTSTRMSSSRLSNFDEMSVVNEREYGDDFDFTVDPELKRLQASKCEMEEPEADDYKSDANKTREDEAVKDEDLSEKLKLCIQETDI